MRTAPHELQFDKQEAERLLGEAVATTDWKVVEDTVEQHKPTKMHRVLVRKVEVPVKRQVKVPIKTRGIERVKRKKRVKVKRLVEVRG